MGRDSGEKAVRVRGALGLNKRMPEVPCPRFLSARRLATTPSLLCRLHWFWPERRRAGWAWVWRRGG